MELQESAKRKGHFALYNCLVLGPTKNKGVQRMYSIILQPVSRETVLRQSPSATASGPCPDSAAGYRPWSFCRFAQYCLLCSGITPFSSLCYDLENGYYLLYIDYSNYEYYCFYSYYTNYVSTAGWSKMVGSQIVYELDHRKPVLYVIPIENILGKRFVVPVGDTEIIPQPLRNVSPGAPGDRRPGWMQDVVCHFSGH